MVLTFGLSCLCQQSDGSSFRVKFQILAVVVFFKRFRPFQQKNLPFVATHNGDDAFLFSTTFLTPIFGRTYTTTFHWVWTDTLVADNTFFPKPDDDWSLGFFGSYLQGSQNGLQAARVSASWLRRPSIVAKANKRKLSEARLNLHECTLDICWQFGSDHHWSSAWISISTVVGMMTTTKTISNCIEKSTASRL